ncbi:MAG: hypothetical protein M3401_07405 [Actinomycetota bacterium]|nr:hypothetical protein [Actinomycetota bacterium]
MLARVLERLASAVGRALKQVVDDSAQLLVSLLEHGAGLLERVLPVRTRELAQIACRSLGALADPHQRVTRSLVPGQLLLCPERELLRAALLLLPALLRLLGAVRILDQERAVAAMSSCSSRACCASSRACADASLAREVASLSDGAA